MDNLTSEEEVERTSKLESSAFQKQAWKDVLILCFGFLLLFTAYQSLTNLQSSLHSEVGLGTTGLAVIYACLVVSCLLFPSLAIKYLGCKWTVVAGLCCYSLYIIAHFYPTWWTIVLTSAILGLAGAPLWAAQCTYSTNLAVQVSGMTGRSLEGVVASYFGIFFTIFQTSQVWGNLLSSLLLAQGQQPTDAPQRTCGASFCVQEESAAAETVAVNTTVLIAVYSGLAVLSALFVGVFLTNRKFDVDEGTGIKQLFLATVRQFIRPNQLLLVPLTFYSGLEQAFIASEFSAAFIVCRLGIHWVGYIMICYGVTNSLFSFVTGRLTQYTGQHLFFIFGALAHMSMLALLLTWKPGHLAVFFVVAAFWGVGDAIWQTQINALYGNIFSDKQEAAFANYRLMESAGFIVGFVYHTYLCVYIKIVVLMGSLTCGMVGYTFLVLKRVKV